ncbi:hypothetical protein V3C99_000908 [Haemonchus contortus]
MTSSGHLSVSEIKKTSIIPANHTLLFYQDTHIEKVWYRRTEGTLVS